MTKTQRPKKKAFSHLFESIRMALEIKISTDLDWTRAQMDVAGNCPPQHTQFFLSHGHTQRSVLLTGKRISCLSVSQCMNQ